MIAKITETLRHIKIKFVWIISVAVVTLSCDVLESDPDVLEPSTTINGKEIYVRANSPTIVDLSAKVQTNTPVRLSVTSDPQHGEIDDLGKGLLQYSPSIGNSRGRDSFEFTVYTLDNEIIKRDTVVIYIESDSTNLPCDIYPATDYVFGVDHDPVVIDVTSNDIICGGNVVVTVYKPEESFPPYFGTAEVVGNKIKYSPRATFEGADKIFYKVSLAADTAKAAYGIVYLTGDSICSFRLADDLHVFNEYAADSLVMLNVFDNDSLCHAINQYQVSLKSAPIHGLASLVTNGFTYKVPATASIPFSDHFTYEVCIDATCRTARVDIKLKKDSLLTCVARALEDSFDISNYNTSQVYLDVLKNDSTCGNLTDFRIAKAPLYGTAGIVNKTITYHGSVTAQKNDSLRYEICNGGGCSSAIVYIKRKK
jgi:hypothetical protein